MVDVVSEAAMEIGEASHISGQEANTSTKVLRMVLKKTAGPAQGFRKGCPEEMSHLFGL